MPNPTIIKESRPSKYFGTHLEQHPKQFQPTRMSRKKYIAGNIRTAIEQVFGALGSWEGMLAWAKDNPDMFYGSVVPKLLPAELAESGAGSQIKVIVYGVDQQVKQSIDITPASTQVDKALTQAETDQAG